MAGGRAVSSKINITMNRWLNPAALSPMCENSITTATTQSLRWKSSSGGKKSSSFRPRRAPGKDFVRSHQKQYGIQPKKIKGHPKMDVTGAARDRMTITDVTMEDDEEYDLGPLMDGALQSFRRAKVYDTGSMDLDVEAQLKMMDYFTSDLGSTEDLVGARRAVALEAFEGEDPAHIMAQIDRMVDQERTEYMDLPPTDPIRLDDLEKESNKGSNQIPPNQLAHGDWGEMLIRTDRVTKMWRGGKIQSYRALVIGGNLRGCGGFGIGKSFEPEDAVELACRMAKRNIFFVDRYRGRGLTRDLAGRQNSCRVHLRSTDNGLRGNPLCCEILKLMGITNVVAKAHGSRNHYNVVRATFKALLTHESLEEIAMKRGVRLINLQRARRLQI
jgi:small subunit ribosomal protein S5